MLVFAKLLLVDEGAQVPAGEPHLEAVVAHVVEGGGGEDLPEAAALELLRHDGGEEVQHRVGLSGRQKKYPHLKGFNGLNSISKDCANSLLHTDY